MGKLLCGTSAGMWQTNTSCFGLSQETLQEFFQGRYKIGLLTRVEAQISIGETPK